MPHKSGKIEAVSIKEMPQTDKFGNTHRANLKIGEDWFAYGTLKKPAINVKKGQEWVQVSKGMGVEFMYDESGDWKNIQKKSFSVLDATSAPASKPNTGGASKPSGDFVNPAEIGQCMNLAVEVLKYSGEDMLSSDKAVEAIQWYKRSRQLFTSLYAGVDMEKTYPTKPVVEEESFDDDDI